MADLLPQLNDQQKQAVIDLATGATNNDVAKKIGCHRNTVLNWKKNPAFTAGIVLLRLAIRKVAREEIRKQRWSR